MDLEKYRKTDFVRRTARVSVPALSDFFGDGPAEVEIRNLSGPEIWRAENRPGTNAAIEEVARKLSSGRTKVVAEGVLQAFGMTDDVPAALVKMIAYVEAGVVLPGWEQSDAVRLLEFHPVTFFFLFNRIERLCGLGAVAVGESSATGTMPESATP